MRAAGEVKQFDKWVMKKLVIECLKDLVIE